MSNKIWTFRMSSKRRSRSRDKKLPSKLRMDAKPPTPRITGILWKSCNVIISCRSFTDPSLPAGRRKEIDNVMKKARANTSPTSGAFWDKKLLEVEAKDPNRYGKYVFAFTLSPVSSIYKSLHYVSCLLLQSKSWQVFLSTAKSYIGIVLENL